ncbi:hypothetical protein LTR37_001617 [Vermiconidia calcicola]|uniref:Uncharacterized protein n=1 Tax=Vermiconidia calcicola TaxID=1690605 RepID=A0ACC3NVP5_9PEZI|nr:hypothetical protein LTR37_001617 [Vermiconidia calcicola]
MSRTLQRIKHLLKRRRDRKRPGAAVQDEGRAEPVDQEIGSGTAEGVDEVVDGEIADGDDEGAPVAVDEVKIQYGEAHLLGLPAEIRNRIYDFAVPKGNTYPLKTGYPPICRVSRRFLSETGPIWRFCNAFVLHLKPLQILRKPEQVSDDYHYIKSLRIILQAIFMLYHEDELVLDSTRDTVCINIIKNTYSIFTCTSARSGKSGSTICLKNLCRISQESEVEQFRSLAPRFEFFEDVLDRQFVQAVNEEVIKCVAH